MQAAGATEQARILLGLNWNSVQRMMDKAVERGLIIRDLEEIKQVGIDEKSFRRCHDYITVLTDIDQSRVLEVTQRGIAATKLFSPPSLKDSSTAGSF